MFDHYVRAGLTAVLIASGCGGDDGNPGVDASVSMDGGSDAGASTDSGAGTDATVADTGAVDAGESMGDAGITLACTLEEVTPIVACARTECVSLPDGGLADASLPDPGELATCILTNCGTLLLSISPGCRDCLIAGVGMNVDEISMRCANGIPVR